MKTFASVTDIVCTCGYLDKKASDPDHPVAFDPEVNEFHFVVRGLNGEPKAKYCIYHCPFCGGATPESVREHLFSVIPDAEDGRLRELFSRLKTIDQVVEKFGPPDFDYADGCQTNEPERYGRPPVRKAYRVLKYTELRRRPRCI